MGIVQGNFGRWREQRQRKTGQEAFWEYRWEVMRAWTKAILWTKEWKKGRISRTYWKVGYGEVREEVILNSSQGPELDSDCSRHLFVFYPASAFLKAPRLSRRNWLPVSPVVQPMCFRETDPIPAFKVDLEWLTLISSFHCSGSSFGFRSEHVN